MRKVFNKPELEESLSRDGYFTLPLLSKEDVARLRQFYEQTPPPDVDAEFYTTHWSQQKEYRQLVDDNLRPLLAERALPLFNDYKACFGYFFVKHPTEGSAFHIHQDWSLVDEDQFRGVTLWIALDDTDVNNGCMHVVPRSHLFANNLRGTNIETPYRKIDDLIEEKFCQPVPLKAGETLFFDQRLLHFTPPNRADKTRVAAGLVTIPRETTFVHYYLDEASGNVTKYIADDEFLLEMGFGEKVEEKNYQCAGEYPYETAYFTERELKAVYNRLNGRENKLANWLQSLKQKLTPA